MSVERLVVVTHVTHYQDAGAIYAYGPYVREINVWCDLFPQIVIAAPCASGPRPGDSLAISRDNVILRPIEASGGDTLGAKLKQLCLLPWIVFQLCAALRGAGAIHVRCPGNLGFLGIILAPLFCKNLVAKYAGQWTGYPSESLSVRLQRFLLRSRWWRGVVTVYSDTPNHPAHVIPFFTSVMTPGQIQRAEKIAARETPDEPFSILFVGRLSASKNVDVLIDAVAELKRRGIVVRCDIVGHGAEQARLADQAARQDLTDCIHFAGAVDFSQVFDFYERAHVLVLVSDTEGWPKVIAEAMACGLVCIGSDRGLVPWMLGGNRGFVVPPGDVPSLSATLYQLATSPTLRRETSTRAAEFGQRYSLDTLRDALSQLLTERWGVEVGQKKVKEETPANDKIEHERVALP